MKPIFVLCALLLAILPGTVTAQANKQGLVTCIQQGLLDRGYDPNGVDGFIGRGTIAAASRWASDTAVGGLPGLTPSTGSADLRDWCFAVQPPVEMFGTVFQIVALSGGGLALSDTGPAAIDHHRTAAWMRVRGGDRGLGWEDNTAPAQLSRAQRQFLAALPDRVEVLGISNRAAPGVLAGFEVSEVWGNRTGRTYAVDGRTAPMRMVVFDGAEPRHAILAATAQDWGFGLDYAVDWEELFRLHAVPRPGF